MTIILKRVVHVARAGRAFSTTPLQRAPNRIYDRIRDESSFRTALLLSSSSRKPLITLWTASYDKNCAVVAPIIQGLIESHPALADKGIGYAEVEIDAPDCKELWTTYGTNEIPRLLAFDRQEPQITTAVTDVQSMKNQKFLIDWIEAELARGGQGGGGGSLFGGLYGFLKL